MSCVVGIDPAQSQAGIAVVKDGRVMSSASFCPWGPEAGELLDVVMAEADVPLFICEIPQNGTHRSRGGVMFGAGLIFGLLLEQWDIRRRDIEYVTPAVWRKAVLGRSNADKGAAVRRAKRLLDGRSPADHNEAEAICIAVYGCQSMT